LFIQDTKSLHSDVIYLIGQNAPLSDFENLLGINAEKVLESEDGPVITYLLKYEGLPPFSVLITWSQKTGKIIQTKFG
jgi:hypothetical protein